VAKFMLRRMVYLVILVIVATTFAYLLAASTLNPRAKYENHNPPIAVSSINNTLNALNMNPDTPVLTRFARWGKDVLHGNLGQTVDSQPIWQTLNTRMWVSLRLVLVGSIIGAVIGCAMGAYGAVKQYRFADHAMSIWSFVVLSIPIVVLSVLVKLVGIKLNAGLGRDSDTNQLLYTVGEYSTGRGGWNLSDILDRLQHLALPSLVLIIAGAAFYSRYQRNAMLDVLGADFLRTARAKGLRRTRALIKHGLRTALIPLTTFFSYSLLTLFLGSFFVEYIFSWNGMGLYLVNAIIKQDINSTAATTLFVAILVLIAGFVSDLAYAALDPRVRVS
jgi:peptide/nickel transport system permease protein